MKTGNFQEAVILPFIKIIPFGLMQRIGSCKLIIVTYHVVNDQDVPHVIHLYKYKKTSQFIEDLDFLLCHYTPIALSELIDFVKGKRYLPPNSLLLTFDDGYREIYDVVAPILIAKSMPATFFISNSFLNNKDMCYEQKGSLLIEEFKKGISRGVEQKIKNVLLKNGINSSSIPEGILGIDYRRRAILDSIAEFLEVDFPKYLDERQPYLTTAQIKKLIDQGFTIGAHSMDHPYYSGLSLSEQLDQTLLSVKQIREAFGLNYGAFAFPHNDTGVSQEFFKRVEETRCVDITFGTGGMLDGTMRSHRQRVSLEKPLLHAKYILKWQYTRKIYWWLRGGKKAMTSSQA